MTLKFLYGFLVLALLGLLMCDVIHAAQADTCYWQVCEIVENTNAVGCSRPGKGDRVQLRAFTDSVSGRGKIINAECVAPTETPALGWQKSGVFFRKQ